MSIQGSTMFLFSLLSADASIWIVAVLLAYYGGGAGLMLVALHRAAMHDISETQMDMATGLCSMLRFLGMVIGTALAGMLLQRYLDLSMPTIEAYQNVYLLSRLCTFRTLPSQ